MEMNSFSSGESEDKETLSLVDYDEDVDTDITQSEIDENVNKVKKNGAEIANNSKNRKDEIDSTKVVFNNNEEKPVSPKKGQYLSPDFAKKNSRKKLFIPRQRSGKDHMKGNHAPACLRPRTKSVDPSSPTFCDGMDIDELLDQDVSDREDEYR
ncbi:hypothetical protein DPMN_073664 [Dreissena polymorpha]|uniref:Uncharacterized protein n=1 Tax=Dreissena polymorpha TaxID=45954 RepID=A0A9D4HDR9_DREPO|nr:hypothetical protein DPMN_073664 [Dreissena polymorpha]